MHGMLKFKNTSKKISKPNYHISYDENHVYHAQSHYKEWTFGLYPWEKLIQKEK
jgi:hypothetical protein